jgi:uncharacterized Zn finger protein
LDETAQYRALFYLDKRDCCVINFSSLSETQVRKCASGAVFQRGKDYFKEGCVRDALLVSPTEIKGHVQGNHLYRTKVRIESGELVCECNCPFDWEPFCKHGIALLLYWVDAGKDVPKLNELKSKLLDKSKEELAELVLKEARRNSQVMRKLAQTGHTPVSEAAFQRRVKQIFGQQRFWDWDEMDGLTEDLESIIEEGREYAHQGDPGSALACFEAVAAGIAENVNDTHTEGQLEATYSDAVEEMVKAFAQLSPPKPRAEKKLEAWIRMAVQGGFGFEEDVLDAILNGAKPWQLALAEQIAKKMLGAKNGKKSSHEYDSLAAFLLDLNLKQGRDGEFVRNAEKHFEIAYEKLVDHYLERKQHAQALQTAKRAIPLTRGYQTSDLQAKIAQAQKALGRTDDAFETMQDAFLQDQDLAKYYKLKAIAGKSWNQRRKKVLDCLENAGETETLSKALAADEDVAGMKKMLAKLTKDDDEELRVIEKALRRKAPASSAKALTLLALHSLRWTDRNGYRMAADYLATAKSLLEKNGKTKEFSELARLIERLKRQNLRRPAFQDEFQKAKL